MFRLSSCPGETRISKSPPTAPHVNKVKHKLPQTTPCPVRRTITKKINRRILHQLQRAQRTRSRMECLRFLVEPAKELTIRLKDSRGKAEKVKKESLVESQLFIMELARELSRLCQRAEILGHIWNGEDVWPPQVCQAFILDWASQLESQMTGCPDKHDQREPQGRWSEEDVERAQGTVTAWSRGLRSRPELSVWPGESVVVTLDDLEAQWKRGRMPNLQSAMELVIWAVLTEGLDKEAVPRLWLTRKQRRQKIAAAQYIPHTVWNWICEASVEVTLDLDTANPDLLISPGEKRMRCGFERKDVPNFHGRFDGWWCAVGVAGLRSGRHYWEVEVGERDWRLGVAKESALRKGFKSLNTDTGYLTLRLERGSELKALTVPYTPLPSALIPCKVGVYLDCEEGQLSFYDAEKRSHIYTYNEAFGEALYPLFGTVEIVRDLVIKPVGVRDRPCCSTLCLRA
ncbi:tripartite motif-containing protein 6-like isoform X1 [Anguilla rostrata]|uniref:tripartite motif-containing protein 6-like isoform X1 n=2 Tax=Anguilla rostrata TaxID=7938 RepID=UPI0030D00352